MFHTAIIMDGNGRWATRRRLPRVMGHRHGASAVQRAIECAPGLGITDLTLYAFSSDNWRRPEEEVGALMRLLLEFLDRETARCVESGVRLSAVGRRDRLSTTVVDSIVRSEAATRGGARLHVRIALDYSSRDQMLAAVAGGARSREEMSERLLPAVDLLIRTAGEQRLSDFLLWECAYAEMHFTRTLWPDFGRRDLEAAVADFRCRERRFGGLPLSA